MTDKDFYNRIDKACSLFTSREAVARYCHDIRMLEDTIGFFNMHKGQLSLHSLTGDIQIQRMMHLSSVIPEKDTRESGSDSESFLAVSGDRIWDL